MELREIIIIFGLVAIVVIIWDGVRRMKRPPQKIKSEPYIDPDEAARQAQIARELPNGGARVREMTDAEKNARDSKLNLRERVPMLMERVEVKASEDSDEADERPAVQAELDFTAAMAELAEPSPLVEPSAAATDDAAEQPSEPSSPAAPSSAAPNSETSDETPAAEPALNEAPAAEPAAVEEADVADAQAAELGPVEDLVIIHVMAADGEELSGSKVLDLLVTAGLRHGPMDIFHYRNPKRQTEFSLANCVQPGTFDPDAMNQVATPGVTLFMQLPCAADAMAAFDHMYEMAVFLAKHLDAQILDEDHSTVTPQRIEYYREKLRAFARSKLISTH